MNSPTINFRSLRIHTGSQNMGFEELTRQIVIAENYPEVLKIEHRGPGADGGVEILVQFQDGTAWGWQSKWFVDAFGSNETAQLKKSFRSAFKNFPNLSHYIIAIPRNLSNSAKGNRHSQQKHWDQFVKWVNEFAAKQSKAINIELWDETFFVSRLQLNDSHHIGMRHYWFNSEVLSSENISQQLQKSLNQIQDRYSPEFHVDLRISQFMHTLRRSPEYVERVNSFAENFEEMQKAVQYFTKHQEPRISDIGQKLGCELSTIQNIVEKMDFSAIGSIDLSPLNESLSKFESCDKLDQLSNICWEEREAKEKETVGRISGTNRIYAHADALEKFHHLKGQISSVSKIFHRKIQSLLCSPNLLLLGDAGTGKSHLLADEIKRHTEGGGVGFFIPAQNIHDPLKAEEEILSYLEFANMTFSDFLGMLSAVAYASEKPVLVAIDAINESDRMERWIEAIPKLISQFNSFPNISVVISCRSDYSQICVPQNYAPFTEIQHTGFAEDVGSAAKIYLDKHGIERPSVPIFGLEGQFANPLFLSTCVKAIKNEGKTVFPSEIDSFPELLRYWLSSIETNLVRKGFRRLQKGDRKLERIVFKIAEEMALNFTEYLSFEKASQICESVINLNSPTTENEKVINQLLSEGVLIDRFTYEDNKREIAFTFQRFTDYFLADAIIRLYGTRVDLAAALSEDGDFSRIFDRSNHDYFSWDGLRQALLALIPLKFDCEPTDLIPGFYKTVQIPIADYLKSIPWRKSKITKDTKKILTSLLEPKDGEKQRVSYEEWFDLLIELTLTTNCPLNADYLFRALSQQSMADRDAVWSHYLVGKTETYEAELYSNVRQLIDWAWVAPKTGLELKRVELAATCLGLFFTTSDRSVRDQSTKALASLFIKYPEIVEPILEKFNGFNDAYVRERIFSAVYGGLLYVDNDDLIKRVGEMTLQLCFKQKSVETHAMTRRYAQLIVELAQSKGLHISDFDIEKIRPPYASKPITHWPNLEGIRAIQDEMTSVVWSVVGQMSSQSESNEYRMPGDFGRYTMSPDAFLARRQSEGPPLTVKEIKDQFWEKVRKKSGEDIVELLLHTKCNIASLEMKLKMLSFLEADNSKTLMNEVDSELPKELERLGGQFKKIEKLLLQGLSKKMKNQYLAESMYPSHHDETYEKFPEIKAQCWVVNRVKEIGWKKKVHENLERYGGGHHEHRVERIGKKYQWIAYNELISYLQDHHWHQDWSDFPSVLERLEEFHRMDIDPSFLASPNGLELCGLDENIPSVNLPEPISGTPDQNIEWTKTKDDLPDPTKFIVKKRILGGEWWIVSTYLNAGKEDSENYEPHPIRTTRFHLNMLIIPKGRENELLEAMKDPEQHDHNEYYFHEGDPDYLYAQSPYLAADENFYPKFDHEIYDVPVMSPTMGYSTSERQYDNSGTKEYSSFLIPRWPLINGLNLKPQNAQSKVFCSDNGAPVFIDNSDFFYGGSCVIRGDILRKFLDQNSLTAVWRVYIEKDGGFGALHSQKRKINRETFAGLLWQCNGSWHGEIVHKVGEH